MFNDFLKFYVFITNSAMTFFYPKLYGPFSYNIGSLTCNDAGFYVH